MILKIANAFADCTNTAMANAIANCIDSVEFCGMHVLMLLNITSQLEMHFHGTSTYFFFLELL